MAEGALRAWSIGPAVEAAAPAPVRVENTTSGVPVKVVASNQIHAFGMQFTHNVAGQPRTFQFSVSRSS